VITNINHMLMKALAKEADKRGYSPEIKAKYVQENYATNQKSANEQDAIVLGAFGAAAGKALGRASATKTSAKVALLEQFSPVIDAWKNAFQPMESMLKVKKMSFKDTLVDAFKQAGKILKGAYDSLPKSVKIMGAALIALSALKYQNDRTVIKAKYDAVQYMKDNA